MTTRLCSLVLSAAVCSSIVWGQAFTASVLGTVTDNSGAVVPKASVTVVNLGTQQQVVVETDAGGNYIVPLLPPGQYRVSVEVQGFKRAVREPVTLQVDERQRLDFQLELGQVTENVTVLGGAAQVQTENATVGTAVTRQQTSELPLNGRNFLQLNLLVPGAQSTVKGSNLSGEGGSIEVHGLRENSNYFWVDGMDNTTQAIGEYVVNVPPFTISEFRVMSPTYDAEFGRTAGAQINVITRSGGNSFHGDAYEFLRNSALDAKNFFDPAGPIPVFRRHQFGGDLGGRIKRDRSFFYAAWEGLRQAQGESASNSVPTAQEVQGNFSDLPTPIIDPQTGKPFPGNIIRPDRINAIGAALASRYPAPNGPGGRYNVSPTGTLSDDVALVKLDQIITSNNRLSGRIAFEDINYVEPISQYNNTTFIPGFGLIENANHNYTAGISDIHTFSPTLLGEVRVGFNRFQYHYLQQDHTDNVDGSLGLGAPLVSTNPRDYGFPLVEMSGVYSALGSSTVFPQFGPFDTWFVAPTVTWIKGKHAIKFGGDFHHFDSDYLLSNNARGTFSFNGQFTGNPLSDLLLGLPSQASVGYFKDGDTQFLFVSREVAAFVQDDWRLTRRFTLTLGLRYEYPFPATERQNRMSNFDPATGQIVIAGQNGAGSELYNADPHEFAPRAGFAWDMFGNGKWAVRGGYGLFYELTMINQVLGMRLNLPFFTSASVLGDGKTVTLNNVFSNAQAVIPSLSAFAQNYKAGRVQQFSVGVQHEILPNLILDVGYVGNRGDRLFGSVDLNQPLPGPGNVQARRIYPTFAYIFDTEPVFSSQYDGLEVRAEKRMANGMSFLASFTWSHAFDNSSASGGYNGPQDNHNIAGNWGPSIYDVRTRFVFSYLYELPFGKGKTFLNDLHGIGQAVLGGWQLNGILTLHSGLPFTPVLATDTSNTGEFADRPDVVGNPYQSSPTCQVRTPNCWVNPAAFATPAQYTFGNAGRNDLFGPGFKDLDFALLKNFPFGEQRRVEFRAEAFNLLNNVNFDNPVNTLGASFGKIFSAGGNAVGLYGSRQIQFGLRVIF